MKARHRHPRGYVLLTTIALLVLASTLLIAVGRSAVDHALLARRDQSELQRRWGIISARAAVLPYSGEILSRLEANGNGAVPVYRTIIRLGDSRYTLIVSDEQAKANINSLLDEADQSSVEDRLQETLSGSGLGNSVFLHPFPLAGARPAKNGPTLWITGLGQIFNSVPPEKLNGGNSLYDFGAAQNITCWGNGAINILRAREPALRLALGHQLTKLEITHLIAERDVLMTGSTANMPPVSPSNQTGSGKPDPDPINQLLNAARINPKERGQMALTTHSACYSLWIIVNDRQRSWTSLFVADASDLAKTHTASFVW
jgi:hypothetical protein